MYIKGLAFFKNGNLFRLLEKPSFVNKDYNVHNCSDFTVFLASAKKYPGERFSALGTRPFSTFTSPCQYKLVLSHSMHVPHPGIL